MPKEIVHTPDAPTPVGPYSQAVKVGPLFFVSGQIPVDPRTGSVVQGGVTKQTEQALANLKAVVEASGATMSQVTKVTVYLSDLEDFKFMNQAYEKYFSLSPPARVCLQAKVPKGALVEIDAQGVIG